MRVLRALPLLLLAHCALVPSRPDDLALSTLDGGQVRLGDVRRSVTVVAVWVSWCVPCREELPLIEALYRSYAGDPDVSVITVSLDTPGKTRALAHELGLTAPVFLDKGSVFHAAVGLDRQILPLFVIFDRDGKAVLRETGFGAVIGQAYVAAKRSRIEAVRRQQQKPAVAAGSGNSPPQPPAKEPLIDAVPETPPPEVVSPRCCAESLPGIDPGKPATLGRIRCDLRESLSPVAVLRWSPAQPPGDEQRASTWRRTTPSSCSPRCSSPRRCRPTPGACGGSSAARACSTGACGPDTGTSGS